jgi:hypothetical protein
MTARMAEAGGQTVPPGGLTACDAEADGSTTSSGGLTTRQMTSTTSPVPRAATMIPASPSVPHSAPTSLSSTSVPHAVPMTPPTTSSVTPNLPSVVQPVPHVLLANAVALSPVVYPYPIWTRGAVDF